MLVKRLMIDDDFRDCFSSFGWGRVLVSVPTSRYSPGVYRYVHQRFMDESLCTLRSVT